MKLSRRTLIGATAALGAAGIGLQSYRSRASELPRVDAPPARAGAHNVLFILTDQERSWAQLPADFIDRHCPNRAWLRDRALQIQHANTTSQLCSMARATIYTGVHAHHTGVWENTPLPYSEGLRRDVPTLGSVFQDGGYFTGYVGKWHLTHMQNETVAKDADRVRPWVRSFGFDEALLDGDADGAYAGQQLDATIAGRVVDFMQRQRLGTAPWMLAVNLVNPHDVMYYTSGENMTRSRVTQFPDQSARPPETPFYQKDLGYPVFGTWGPASRDGKPRAVQEYSRTMDEALGHMPYDNEAVAREFQNYYFNCIRDSDRQLGVLIEGLRQSGQLDHTLIVFTSDHGEFLGAHGLRGKGSSIYREASEVPLLIVHPDGPRGRSVASLSSAADLLPTLLGLAGLDTRHYFEQLPKLGGMDLSGLLSHPQDPGPRDEAGILAYWTGLTFLNHENVRRFDEIQKRPPGIRQVAMLQMMRETIREQRGAMRGLITQRYKFARYFKPTEHQSPDNWEALVAANDLELYDLHADPREITNLAAMKEHRDTVLRLNAQLNQRIAREIGVDDGRFLPIYMRA